MVNLDKFKKKLSNLVLKRIEEIIQEKIEEWDFKNLVVDTFKEDKETLVYVFHDRNRKWDNYFKFTLVIYKVEDVDVCCDDLIITFNVNAPLMLSFAELDNLLDTKFLIIRGLENEE